ncbi:MAG: Methionyl-tRNA formyltransferase [Gammaproteobacteria bacterium]|nr:Methionyl-tRNA formyltransferase [Gammaproteobacteria bacterium]
MTNPRIRIVFAGTPEFAAVSLRALLGEGRNEIVAVYCQPDRPAGRGRRLTACAVKQLAVESGLPVHQPVSFKETGEIQAIRALRPDLLIVVAYGLILPRALLEIPRLGCVNVHASLLPRWRGAAPIERAIMAGDTETGVTLMRVEPRLDSGPVLAVAQCPIAEDDTAGTLHDRLARLGAALLVSTLPSLVNGTITSVRQDDRRATYAAKIGRREAELDWSMSAEELARRVRALNPRLGASATIAGETVKIWLAESTGEACARPPGEIVRTGSTGIEIATGDGVLRLLSLQPPGRHAVSAADFLNARPRLKERA